MVETAEGISIQQATVEETAPIITQVEGSTGWLGKLTSLVRRNNKSSASEAQKPEAIANVKEVAVPRPPRKQSEIFADEDADAVAKAKAAEEAGGISDATRHFLAVGLPSGIDTQLGKLSADVTAQKAKEAARDQSQNGTTNGKK